MPKTGLSRILSLRFMLWSGGCLALVNNRITHVAQVPVSHVKLAIFMRSEPHATVMIFGMTSTSLFSRTAISVGLIGSLLCAGAVAAVSRRWPERREALIGLLYVVFACLTLLGARMDAHGRDRMLELLAADVLWAQAPPVQVLAAAAALLLGLLAWRPELLTRDAVFYSVFAVMVSLAVPVLGLFVVFGLLIGPALWMRREEHRSDLWLGITTGAGAALSGLVASWWWDAPSGPSVALACALLGLGALVRRSAD